MTDKETNVNNADFHWAKCRELNMSPFRPYLEEPRNVMVQRGAEPLGISIVSGETGGVFVSKVTAGSIAHQAHLEYGDQLLEVKKKLQKQRKRHFVDFSGSRDNYRRLSPV